MLAKLRQLEWAQGFVLLMYNFLEKLGKVMEFVLLFGSAVYGNSLHLLPVRALNPPIRVRGYQRRGTSRDLSGRGRARHLNPARRPSLWSPFSE